MYSILQPIDLVLIAIAGWMNERQRLINAYLMEENRVQRELFGTKRLRLTDDQRRRLAVKGKALGRKLLREVACIVAPDTILAWYHKLVAMKWDYSRRRRPGRPRLTDDIRQLVVRMALENRRWGYERIQGVMKELGHTIAATTVRNILKENGIEPAPERSRNGDWSTFLKSHWKSIAAADFFTVEVCTWRGLVTHYALFFIDLATRRVHLGGITTNPNTAWMMQIAKNVTDPFDGFLEDKKFLIIDRDTKYCEAFRQLLKMAGVQPIRLPPKSPNMNAYAERFVRSIKEECLDQMIFFGESSLRNAIDEYLEHYHRERPHQGLGNRYLESNGEARDATTPVERRERLGGLLRSYHRRAA
ncbi:MAG: transposase [Planctomycetes bacterium]|nr:transposase [Planctomycetota bacterium]